jgi:hypothetical protein
MEDGSVEMTVIDIGEEILGRDRRLVLVDFDPDLAHRRLHDDDGVVRRHHKEQNARGGQDEDGHDDPDMFHG